MDAREHAIKSAIRNLESGVYTSQRAAAKAWGVPRSTLQYRLAGQQPHAIAHQHQQRLSPEQEEFLVDWIPDEDARAQPPPHARVREMATRLLQLGGDHDPLGQRWLQSFLARQPRVSSIVGRSIEAARAQAVSPAMIQTFLELFERTRIRLNIQLSDIWNMDETGVALGVCTNTRVIARAGKKKAYKKDPGNREWVSIIESVSATGQKLRCMVIFKGKSLQTTWFPSKLVPDWIYTTSENGWTANVIGLEWLRRIYIPETTPDIGQHRMLILDGHGSHIDIEFMWLCRQRRIHLLYLPAHASHLLQPLHLAPFSVVKSKYRHEIQALSLIDDAAPVKKERFISSYHKARIYGLSEQVIRAGSRATGLVPYNPDIVLSSSQISARPITPPLATRPIYISDPICHTPQRSQDVYRAQQHLQRSESLSRNTRTVLAKAAKAISLAQSHAAQLQASNQLLHQKLDSIISTKVRKRTRIDPNSRFSNIDTIMAAIDHARFETAESSTSQAAGIASRSAQAIASVVHQNP
jgi:hypothetical protein